MQNTNNKQKRKSPPNLLKGMLISVFGITFSILVLTWLAIDYQIEQLVVKRTSEYAHSIARIAADSSAEALLSEDQLQLNLIVQNVAKDPYIRQAAIISEDGQTVTQYPEEVDLSHPLQTVSSVSDFSPKDESTVDLSQAQNADLPAKSFITRQHNKVFFEPLVYQNITAGWFKLEIDKYKLEQNFREAFVEVQLVTGGSSIFLFILLLFIIFRLDKNVKQLAIHCQHLLLQNNINPPTKKTQWLNSIKELSQSHLQQLKENISLPKKMDEWINTRVIEKSLVCYLEFKIQSVENAQIAQNLTQAENYLNRAIQAFGVQTQGGILSGCLIPILDFEKTTAITDDNSLADKSIADKNALTEAVSLIYLIKQLLSHLTPSIQVKAFITQATILYLENEQDITTGISLLDNSLDKVKQLSLAANDDDVISLSIPPMMLEKVANITAIESGNFEDKNYFKLVDASPRIQQQIARKFQYISKNQPAYS